MTNFRLHEAGAAKKWLEEVPAALRGWEWSAHSTTDGSPAVPATGGQD